MEYLRSNPELTRRKLLIGAAGIFGAGILAGGLGVDAFERSHQDSPLKPENGEAQANLVIEWLPDTVSRWKPQIEKYSRQYDIDPNLTAIIMTIESGGDPNADSGVATGLMQITDVRATDIAHKFLDKPRQDYKLNDPDTSIEFGAANIRHLVEVFGSSDQGPSWDKTAGLVAAGYYGGEGAADTYRQHGLKGLNDQGTHNYVRYVTTMWHERHDDKSFTYHYWYEQGNGQALVRNAEKYIAP